MTKTQLLEALREVPDDQEIQVRLTADVPSPHGRYVVKVIQRPIRGVYGPLLSILPPIRQSAVMDG